VEQCIFSVVEFNVWEAEARGSPERARKGASGRYEGELDEGFGLKKKMATQARRN
jgi:hypothetical protein